MAIKIEVQMINFLYMRRLFFEVVNTVHTGKSLGPGDVIVLVVYAGSENLPTTVP